MKSYIYILLAICTVALVSCQQDAKTDNEASVAAVLKAANEQKVKKIKKPKAEEVIPSDTVNVASIVFEEETFDFGTVDEGEVVEHNYKFKNTGKVPLVISNAKGSCGCTVPVWPKEPIAVGETGEIQVRFNSKGKKNKQKKTITLTANTWPTTTRIFIAGEVTPDPNGAKLAPKVTKQAVPSKNAITK